jgi:transcriptional regulator with XRE-family HTH domain
MNAIVLNTNSHFGAQLRELRKQMNLTQVNIAERIGCRSDNISHFEKGDNTFGRGSIQTVFKYAKALGAKQVTFNL